MGPLGHTQYMVALNICAANSRINCNIYDKTITKKLKQTSQYFCRLVMNTIKTIDLQIYLQIVLTATYYYLIIVVPFGHNKLFGSY